MKCGYSVSTPASRLADQCQMWAFLAWFDAAQYGPVWYSRLCDRPL